MSSVTNRLAQSPFIEDLKVGNFVICPNKILLGYKEVSPKTKFFYLYLIRYALISIVNGHMDKEGNPVVFAKNETLAKEYGVSRSTVTRYLQELTLAGLCEVTRRGQGKTSLITVYPPNNQPRRKREEEEVEEIVEEIQNKVEETDETIQESIEDIIQKTMQESLENNEKHRKKREERRKNKGPVQNTNTLAKYFETESSKRLKIIPPLIGGKELSLIKTMIEHYKYEVALEMFEWAIENWDKFKKEKRLNGNLNVSIVYGFRDYIASEIQKLTKEVKVDLKPEDEESVW